MGDYVKLIVNCSVAKKSDEEATEFRNQVLEAGRGLLTSAYHCGGEVCHVSNSWHHRTDLVYVCQFKYGDGLPEFLAWLEPQVIDGSGDGEAWAIVFTEYEKEPKIHYMKNKED